MSSERLDFIRIAWVVISFIALLPGLSTEGYSVERPGPHSNVEVSPNGEIHLKAKSAPLAGILGELSRITGVRIRYSDAPDQPISTTCSSSSIKGVLLCLLGDDADLMFEHGGPTSTASSHFGVREVRVLASTFPNLARISGSKNTATQDRPQPDRPTSSNMADASGTVSTDHEDIDALLAMTASRNPEERAEGLNRLANADGIDRTTLRATLEAGLSDPDGEVRAEALSRLARLGFNGSQSILEQGLEDDDASVRLAAVDNIPLDDYGKDLLHKMLADGDSTVRSLAGMKLGMNR